MLRKSAWFGFGIALLLFFWITLLFASQGKRFWTDESDGWAAVQHMSISNLFLKGAPQGQASRSPLAYIVDRSLIKAADDKPLSQWDLRLFYRIPSTGYWALACVFLFFFLRRKFSLLLRGENPIAIFIMAFTATFFVFTNSFSAYYAIEARSYSLWTALTLIQVCFLWNLMTEKNNKFNFLGFMLANYFLVFATYASSLQVGLACGLLLLNERLKQKKWELFGEAQKWILATILGSVFITFYYYAKIDKMNFSPFPFKDYLLSVNEVILKSFRHHGSQPAWVTYPLLFLVIPLYWWKKNKSIALLCLHAHACVLLTYLHYRASLAAGGIYASRYAAFLTPSLSFLYAVGIFTLLFTIAFYVKRKWKKDILITLILIFCLANVLPWLKNYSKGIPSDISRFQSRNSYKENRDPKCLAALEPDPEILEKQNDFCRGI